VLRSRHLIHVSPPGLDAAARDALLVLSLRVAPPEAFVGALRTALAEYPRATLQECPLPQANPDLVILEE